MYTIIFKVLYNSLINSFGVEHNYKMYFQFEI